MDRREHLRTLLLGGLAGSALLQSCTPETASSETTAMGAVPGYGRTPEEQARDARLMAESFFREDEMAALTALCALIIPADERSGSAVDAGVPEFIEFIAKDMPAYQLPLRGGLAWLNHAAYEQAGLPFAEAGAAAQTALLDAIAYPDPELPEEEQPYGVQFFNLMRFLTLTGFYTAKEGVLKDLQYDGNYPNTWDGVPPEVLAEHEVDYDPEWLAKCLNVETRHELAKWDEDGNLLT